MNKYILALLVSFILFGCKESNTEIFFENEEEIIGLASVIQLNPEKTEIFMEDFFPDVSQIDSVSITNEITAELTNNKKTLYLTAKSSKIPYLSILTVYTKNNQYEIFVKKTEKIYASLSFDPRGKSFSKVYIAGDMNGWATNSDAMTFDGNRWNIEWNLMPGNYQYRFFADGKSFVDPANPELVDNNSGDFNSRLTVEDANAGKKPKIFSISSVDGKVIVGSNLPNIQWFVLWDNHLLTPQQSDTIENAVEITIPKNADNMMRSYLRVYVTNEHGLSNDLFIPLAYGKPLQKAEDVLRSDKHSVIMYFLMVDRFNNGNRDNDSPIIDANLEPKANYFGGDIAGIMQKLKSGYFTALGINTIWISPVVQNPDIAHIEYPEPHRKFSGYHGYWQVLLKQVDYRFGTNDELKLMIEEAHKQNINVILDFVSNHVHQNNPMIRQHPEYATNLRLPDGSLNVRLWDENRLTTWFDLFLPSLDYSNPKVVEIMSDTAVWWLKEFQLDGFRHDATKHVPEVFWRRLTQKIKNEVTTPYNKEIFQIGETFGSRELIGSYVGSGKLDGQFDFAVYFDARSVFASENISFERLSQSVNESLKYYGYHSLMGNITGNHDIPRFISYAGKALDFNEDAVEAGWTRDVQVRTPFAYNKLSMLTAFILTIPGVPVIYYGDEIGMPGAGDPDNRRQMRFEFLTSYEEATKETAVKLIQIRRNSVPLHYGDYEELYISDNQFVYARTYFNDIVITAFNNSPKEKEIKFAVPPRFSNTEIQAQFGNHFVKVRDTVFITLPEFSFDILMNKDTTSVVNEVAE